MIGLSNHLHIGDPKVIENDKRFKQVVLWLQKSISDLKADDDIKDDTISR